MAGKFDPKCTMNILAMADMHKLVDDILKKGQLTQAEANALKSEMTGRVIKEGASFKKISDMTAEYIINGYLTSATNLSTNILSGATQTFMSPILREIEAVVGKITADKADQRRSGEGLIMLKSLMQGFGEGLDFSKSGWVTGKPSDFKINLATINSNAKEMRDFGIKYGLDDARTDMLAEKIYDYHTEAIPGTVGKILRLGSKAGLSIDEFWKATLRRVEFNAKAYRDADLLADKFGVSPQEAYTKATEQRMTPDNWDSLMRETFGIKAAADIGNFAKEKVFQERLSPLAASIQEMRNKYPLAGALVAAFIRTPYNIIKEGRAYVPGIGLAVRKETIDPILGKGTGNFEWAINMPVQRERLIAKQIFGFAATMYVNSLVEQGYITGSSPRGDLPKYSIRVGDSWYSYARIEPLATIFGLAADSHQIYNDYVKNSDYYDTKSKEAIATYFIGETLQSVSDNILNKSFVEGLAKAADAAINPEMAGKRFVDSFSTAIIPAGLSSVSRSFDEYERQVVSFTDRLVSRIPGLRDSLPLRYDNMGQPVKTSLSEVLLGVKVFSPTEIQNRLSTIDVDIKGIGRKVGNVELTADQLSFYSQRAGGWFASGLEKTMNSPQWAKYDEFQQERIIRDLLSRSREAGAKDTIAKYYKTDPKFAKDFYNEIIVKKAAQNQYEFKK
jgi:hypothetical protein